MPAIVPGLLLVFLNGALYQAAADRAASPDGELFFDVQVRPILQNHCVACHGGQKTRGGLDMTTRENLFRGGERGQVVSRSKPQESLILQAINYHDLKMPPAKKLPQGQIDILTRWVHMGAPW